MQKKYLLKILMIHLIYHSLISPSNQNKSNKITIIKMTEKEQEAISTGKLINKY